MAKISAFMLENQPPLGLTRYTRSVAAQPNVKSAGYEPKKVICRHVYDRLIFFKLSLFI